MANHPNRPPETIRRSTELLNGELIVDLLANAQGTGLRPDQFFDQRNSFAIASATLSSSSLTRSSIEDLQYKVDLNQNEGNESAAEIEVENLAHQYDFIVSQLALFLSSAASESILTPILIKELHRICFDRLSTDTGQFRSSSIAISHTDFSAPPPDKVPELIQDACDYVDRNWKTKSALHLAAYVLWRLLWVHPFKDGNGRVARAASYLVLSAKLGAILPGTPTLPELISQNKTQYYAALEAADEAERSGQLDVTAAEELIGQLLSHQLQNFAFLPQATKDRLDQLISRTRRSSPHVRQACYGTNEISHRLWSHGPYLALQVGAEEEISQSLNRSLSLGDPFPGLLSSKRDEAETIFDETQSVYFLAKPDIELLSKRSFYLPPDTALILASASVQLPTSEYSIEGALYCLRLGPRTTVENCDETFDLLIARHLRVAS